MSAANWSHEANSREYDINISEKKIFLSICAKFEKAKENCCFIIIVFDRRDPAIQEAKIVDKVMIARRQEQGVHHNLFVELSLEDQKKFRRYFEIKKLSIFKYYLEK